MPKIYHKVEVPFVETFRTAKVAGMFDISPQKKLTKEWNLNFPIEQVKDDWNIGLIVGGSGSGKTILSKQIFGEKNYHYGFDWDNNLGNNGNNSNCSIFKHNSHSSTDTQGVN